MLTYFKRIPYDNIIIIFDFHNINKKLTIGYSDHQSRQKFILKTILKADRLRGVVLMGSNRNRRASIIEIEQKKSFSNEAKKISPYVNKRPGVDLAQGNEINQAITDLASLFIQQAHNNAFADFKKSSSNICEKNIAGSQQTEGLSPYKAPTYHNKYHPRELTNDVEVELIQATPADLSDLEKMIREIMIELAKTASGGHDLVQKEESLKNEKLSSDQVTADWIKKLNLLETKLFSVNSSQDEKQNISRIFQNVKKVIKPIIDELIIPSTYLIFSEKKPLLSFTDADEPSKNSPMAILRESQLLISFFDTNRSLSKTVLARKDMLKTVGMIPENSDEKNKILKLFEALKLTDDYQKEGFLLRLTQNMRMLGELNVYSKRLDSNLIQELLAFSQLAGTDFSETNVSNNLSTSFLNAFCNEKHITGEKDIATSFGDNEHLKIAKARNLEHLLNETNVDQAGWSQHSARLDQFTEHCLSLPAKPKLALGRALLYLTVNQPGVRLEKEFRKEQQASNIKANNQTLGKRTAALQHPTLTTFPPTRSGSGNSTTSNPPIITKKPRQN